MLKILFFVLLFMPLLFAQNLKKVSVQLNWKHQFEFAGFYMAKEMGFYKDVGLDVTLKEFSFQTNVTQDVLAEKSTFGVGYPTLILDRAQGKKVVLLSAFFQSSPLVLVTLQSSHIQSIKDFYHKRIMISDDALESASISSMLLVNFIKPADLIRVKNSFDIKDLIRKKTDIAAAYISDELYTLDQLGVKYKIWDPKNYGFDFYDSLLFTSQKMIQQDPKTVIDFTKATLKGWHYAFLHIDQTIQVIQQKYNTQHKSKNALLYEAKALKKLAYYKENALGEIDPQKIKQIYDIYHFMGKIKKDIDIEKIIYKKVQNHKITQQEIAQYIATKKQVNVCLNTDLPPLSFIKNNKPQGISVDMLDIIFSKLQLKPNYIYTSSWKQSKQFFQEKKCDILPNTIKTHLKNEYANFTKPYLHSKLLIITKKGKALVQNIKELRHKTIVVKEDSECVNELKKRYPTLHIVQVKNYDDVFQYIKNDKAYFTITSLPLLSFYKNNYSFDDLQVAGSINKNYKISFAIQKEDTILFQLINTQLKNTSKTVQKIIYEKWTTQTAKNKIDYTFIYEILAGFFLILLLLTIRYFIMQKYNKKLQNEIELIKQELEQKQTQLLQQSRLAQMGEMISMIAHQWRQPLNAISSTSIAINMKAQMDILDKQSAIELSNKISEFTQHLSKTIDDFRDFFKPNKEAKETNYKKLVEETLSIIETSIKNKNITLIKELDDNKEFTTYVSEVKQVIINIIKNAEDVLAEKEVQNKFIKIKTSSDDTFAILEISDNGGGIDEAIIEKIFDPYFSTKTEKNGTGLGLYMSKMIIEDHCGGKLLVYNNEEGGATFIIKLPYIM
ncbi:histidine kinase [hydrothermal vent metagenome]|uniref:Thiamine pyrimidine synthase n=1 Tax=hydrothermal vent metagenome TaxID=652676 RepID=A0A1W1D4Q5_9ZZZZ